MSTSLVITAYHAHHGLILTTIKCLDSLRYGRPDEVILVDDASPLPFEYDGIQIVRNPENLGYAGTVNAGLGATSGDVIIISNNDVEYLPGWLDAILYPLQNGYDISSIRTTDCDGYDTEDRISEGDKFGSLWAMNRNVYEQLGGFDPSLGKSSFEDLDYRRRALNAGLKIAKNHNGLVEHEGRTTMDYVYPDREDFLIGQKNFIDKWHFLE